MGYSDIRRRYLKSIRRALNEYLSGTRRITSFRNRMNRYMQDYFEQAFNQGLKDVNKNYEPSLQDRQWLNQRMNDEAYYINSLFQGLKQLRKDGLDSTKAYTKERTKAWAKTLDAVYAQGLGRRNNAVMGHWVHGGNKNHCKTCSMLAGAGEHPISWFVKRGYIPREPGSNTLHCKGFQCQCKIVDKDGNKLL